MTLMDHTCDCVGMDNRSLKDAPAGVIVGVVGLGHVDGIERWWSQPISSLNNAYNTMNNRAAPSSVKMLQSGRDAMKTFQSQLTTNQNNGNKGFTLPNGQSISLDQLTEGAKRLGVNGSNKDNIGNAITGLFDRLKIKK
jgi:hypothetical protein